MKLILLSVLIQLISVTAKTQVGIGTTSPDSSASFDVSSTNRGFLPPRMSKAQRNNIASPAAGLMVWCNDCGAGQIQVFNGSHWTNMIGGAPLGLSIGDMFGGGIVAYILQPGDPDYLPGEIHGLIAALTDQGTNVEWGCFGINIPGADGMVLGTGLQNTLDIIDTCFTEGIAARLCHDLVLGGYDDWYLPSKDELNKLYLNKALIGGFADFNYWTSTEHSSQHAWVQYFLNGNTSLNYRDFATSHARAIRSF